MDGYREEANENPETDYDDGDDDDGKSHGENGTNLEISRLCLPLVRRKYARATMHTRTYLPSASAMFVIKENTGRYGNAVASSREELQCILLETLSQNF